MRLRLAVSVAFTSLLLVACAGSPPTPDWQASARSAIDGAVTATLVGDSRAETADLARARSEVARTGRPDLMARVELMHCAAQVASLAFGPCTGFEPLRSDASAPERAYAGFLAAQVLTHDDVEQLPSPQRPIAQALGGPDPSIALVQGIADPQSRLIAVAVLFEAGKASPPMIALAIDTASAQGWRRPLLAWLKVEALRAQEAGDATAAARLQRRIDLVLSGGK